MLELPAEVRSVVLAVGIAGIANDYFGRNSAVNDLTKNTNAVDGKVDTLDSKIAAVDNKATANHNEVATNIQLGLKHTIDGLDRNKV